MSQPSPSFTQALDIVKEDPFFADAVRKYYAAQTMPGEDEKPVKVRWSTAELLTTQFPETKWAIPGILPEGLSILAGRPKLGKSWLALQFAHAVGTGGVALGSKVTRGDVLYLALEDGSRRLQERLRLQCVPAAAGITFITEWRPFSNGGMVDLELELRFKEYRLVIIDTFSRASGGLDDQQDMQAMTRIMGSLQHLSLDHHAAILLIDHHRKQGGFNSDPIDDILGSTGKAAVADCSLGLYRERGKSGASLRVTGRDMADAEMALSWDGQFHCWQYDGPADQVREDSEKGRVLAAVRSIFDLGDLPTTKNIAEQCGIAAPNVNNALQRLAADGLVRRGNKVGVQQPYYPVESTNDER
jgi:hypothetical protein